MLSGIDVDKIILSLFLSGAGYFGKDNHVFLPIIIAFFFKSFSILALVFVVEFLMFLIYFPYSPVVLLRK